MRTSKLRRLAITGAAIASLAVIGIGSASAAGTMPAANPIDYADFNKTASLQVFNVTIKGSQLEGNAFTKSVTNGLPGGLGATISVNKATAPGFTAYQTYATLSGGNFGSGTIVSTQFSKNNKSFIVKMAFDEQATNPNLNLKFYLFKPTA